MKKLLAGAAIALAALASSAQADGHANYPDRPIMLMVSYGAGGATDFQARIVTMTVGNDDALGMPVPLSTSPAPGAASAGTGLPKPQRQMAIPWAFTTSPISLPNPLRAA